MDAIIAALDALFADPEIAEDALWKPGGAEPGIPVRVIRREPEASPSSAIAGCSWQVSLSIRKAEAPTLAEGDVIVVEERSFPVLAKPRVDALGIIYACEAAEL
jgi:hypothetical protein